MHNLLFKLISLLCQVLLGTKYYYELTRAVVSTMGRQFCFNSFISCISCMLYSGNKVEDLHTYITALHNLNEMKDSAEIIIGKLGEFIRCPTLF